MYSQNVRYQRINFIYLEGVPDNGSISIDLKRKKNCRE